MPDQIGTVNPVSAIINKIPEIIYRFIASKPNFLLFLRLHSPERLQTLTIFNTLSLATSCKLLTLQIYYIS